MSNRPQSGPHLPHPGSLSHSHSTSNQSSSAYSHSHSQTTLHSVSTNPLDNPRGLTPSHLHLHLNPPPEAIPYYSRPHSHSRLRHDTPSHSHHSHHYSSSLSHHPHLPWTQEDINTLLPNLHECVPDVGRLFDGSLGSFGFPLEGDGSDSVFDVGEWGAAGGGDADFGNGDGPSGSGSGSKAVSASASASISAVTSGSAFDGLGVVPDIWR